MEVKVGCDIVEIKRFEHPSKETLRKLFHPSELKNTKAETLAGLFAAKESCKKVFSDLDWLDIEISKTRKGKPFLNIITTKKVISSDISISHDKHYAIATAIFLFDSPP